MKSTSLYSTVLLLLLFFHVLVHAQSSSSSSGRSSSATGTGSLNATSSVPSSTNSALYPSLSGYSTCVVNCLQLAASHRGCTSITQTNCYCNSTNANAFEADLISCTQGGCSTELATAEHLAKAFCAVGNTSTSLSFPLITSSSMSSTSLPSASHPMSSSLPSSSTKVPSPSTSSNHAVGLQGCSWMLGLGVSLVSVLIGALSV